MKPFICDACGQPADIKNMDVRWNFDRTKKTVRDFKLIHSNLHLENEEIRRYLNRKLPLEYVFAQMPEFISYISRLNPDKKELKKFVHGIEKGRSYIRRHTVDKKEVKRLILLLDGIES